MHPESGPFASATADDIFGDYLEPEQCTMESLKADFDEMDGSQMLELAMAMASTDAQKAALAMLKATFDAGKDLMLISVGALVRHPEIMDRSRATGCRLLMPSGAIIGLDGIKSASVGHLDHVTMTSRKSPAALDGAPYIIEHEIDLWGLTEETEVFSGSATEAAVGFPANLNISVAVSFAGIGPDRTTVKLVAVPGLGRNCHDIEVEGEFGLMRLHLENIPSENPKTGKLTAMSIIRTIQQAVDPVHLGT